MEKKISYKLTSFGKGLEKTVEELPSCAEDEVIVRVNYCGICHSDLHIQDGYFDIGDGMKLEMELTTPLPLVMGHEVVGTIDKLGSNAQKLGRKIGEKVAIYPINACGDCHQCATGNVNLCQSSSFIGHNMDGGFSSHLVVPERLAVRYESIDAPFAAMCCCSGITTYSAIKKIGQLSKDEQVLFIGAGGLGMMALQLFKCVYPDHVMPVVADIDDVKLKVALQSGASGAINIRTQKKELMSKSKLSWMGQGFASVLDFVGSGETVTLGASILNKGGKHVVVGLFGGKASISTPPLTLKATQVVGNYLGSLNEFKELMGIVSSGRITPPPFSVCPLHQVNSALQNLREGKVIGRTVLKVDQSASL